jgi:hypothetical protein
VVGEPEQYQVVDQQGERGGALDGQARLALGILEPQELLGIMEGDFNGTITSDKFCLSRSVELRLTWWRRPLTQR